MKQMRGELLPAISTKSTVVAMTLQSESFNHIGYGS